MFDRAVRLVRKFVAGDAGFIDFPPTYLLNGAEVLASGSKYELRSQAVVMFMVLRSTDEKVPIPK